MVNPLFSIGGIASGLDTAGIIDQLMQLERQPVTRFEQSQRDLRAVDSAWSAIVGKLSAFRSALDDVRRAGSLSALTTASSSDESAVTVTPQDGGEPGSLSFTVEALATRHRVGRGGAFASASATVGSGEFQILDGDGAVLGTVTTDATTTLSGLASQIDALGVGVDASVLKVGEGNYQLVITANETGAAAQFSTTTDLVSLGLESTLSAGTDAHLRVGGLDIYRASNTIDDLVDGATLQLRTTSAAEVTVTVDRDVETTVERVKALVTTANDVLSRIRTDTAYNAETGKAGVLQGDSLARNLAFELRNAFTQAVPLSSVSYASQVGISLTRDGAVEFDETVLRQALESDPEGVSTYFEAALLGDEGIELTYAGSGATEGAFSVTVSQAATIASVLGKKFKSPGGGGEVFTIITANGTTVDITLDKDMTAAEAVARINAELEAAGANTVRAEAIGDPGQEKLQLSATAYGSGGSFSVTGSKQGLNGDHDGLDVVADFGDGPVTGSGRSITGSGVVAGLTLRITGGVGTYSFEFSGGLGGVLDRYLDELEGVDGRIQAQRDSISGRIRDFDDQIEAFDRRLTLRESKLRAQFSALESAMGRLQSQGQWLAGALGGLGGAAAS